MNHNTLHCQGEVKVSSVFGNPTGATLQCEKRLSCQLYLAHLALRVSSKRHTVHFPYVDAEECIDLENEYYQPTI
ncbi:MAG: hypothetical protein II401_08200 [Bacteroidales bacterium]|nr:hypothetical protein [Bacteroidales bacterium]